jgi:hypothetical protein
MLMALKGDSPGVESRRENRDDGADVAKEGDRADELDESNEDRSAAALCISTRRQSVVREGTRGRGFERTKVAPAFFIFSYCFRRSM